MADRRQLLEVQERRGIAVDGFETRTDGDTLTLEGYASVFDAPYDVFGGPEKGGWSEIVDRRAFDRTLREKPDLHLLVNHEGLPLARTKSGTLSLSTDKTGLKVRASLDRRDPDVQRLQVKMERGDIDEMSFAFRTIEHRWNEDESERNLLEVSLHKGDVSVVNFGANPATSASLRSLRPVLDFLADLDPDEAMAEVRALESRDLLNSAYTALGRLLRETVPPEKRTMSLAEARKAIEAA